jgi:hypothetical protein
MIVANFPNGYTDAYKGHRPVKAAWQIVHRTTGATLRSGHSLTIRAAVSTAGSHLQRLGREVFSEDHPLRYLAPFHYGNAKKKREAAEHDAKRLAEIHQRVEIIIIEL